MQPPELHSALNNATTAFPRVWYCCMTLQHPQFASSQQIHKQKSSLMTTVKFRHWMARRGSNRHRLFQTGRKLEHKEPGRSVHSSLLALSPPSPSAFPQENMSPLQHRDKPRTLAAAALCGKSLQFNKWHYKTLYFFVCLTHVYVSEFLLSHWVTSLWNRIKTPFSSLGLFLLDSNNNPP